MNIFYKTVKPVSIVLVIAITLIAYSLVRADSPASPWLSPASPTLVKEHDLVSSEPLPKTIGGTGNQDCVDMTVVTRPSRLFQSEITQTNCFVATMFGIASSDGMLRFGGSRIAGTSVNYGSYSSGLIPIPSSPDLINYTSTGSSSIYLHFNRAAPGPVHVQTAPTGEITYVFTKPASASLRDKSGSLLPVQFDSLSFSSNGRWMVADSPNHAMLRVNVDTLEVVPFTNPFNYSIGVDPAAQATISNDGRYVSVASKDFSTFELFDISTCIDIPDTINRPASCQHRNLLPYMQSQFGGFIGAFSLRFTSDNILNLYAAWNPGTGLKRANYSLLAPGQTRDKVGYIGMGDSFASGEGDNQGGAFYEPGTDTANNKCHLSKRSYPYLISSSLKIADFHSVACSGAEMRNINGPDIPINFQDKGTPNASYWLPGTRLQSAWIKQTYPDFLTVSVGGNNVDFAGIIIECVTSHSKIPLPNTCSYAADTAGRGNEAKLISDQYASLKTTYEQLVRATNNRTKVYVIGYPKIIKGGGGSCGINVRLNDAERVFIAESTHYMNQVIKAAADAAGVYYLDVESALDGKNLCSIVPDKDMAVNGLTEGNDKQAPWWAGYALNTVSPIGIVLASGLGIGNESFHPNSNGHKLLADRILDLTGGDPGSFTICSALPAQVTCRKGDGKVPLPDSAYFGHDAEAYVNSRNAVITEALISPPTPATMILDDIPSSRQLHFHLDYLMPGTNADIVTKSGARLGQVVVNDHGILDSILTIPAGASVGFQPVYIAVTDLGGEQRSYYQRIFIPGPSGDVNDNGILDKNEPCGFTAGSGIDADQDGIDDACDGVIGEVPSPKSKVTISIRMLKVGR